jgi:hypothetical protein
MLHGDDDDDDHPCSLWMGRSRFHHELLGLFAGVDFKEGDIIDEGSGGIHIPLYDTKQIDDNYIRGATDISDDLLLQSSFRIRSFLPGIGYMYVCAEDREGNPVNNLLLNDRQGHKDSFGIHRHKDPAAGSFSYRHGVNFKTVTPIEAGQQLFVSSCPAGEGPLRRFVMKEKKLHTPKGAWLDDDDTEAICIDTLIAKPSEIAPGRGAFTQRPFNKGDVIISSPVTMLHRTQFDIMEQYYNEDGQIV